MKTKVIKLKWSESRSVMSDSLQPHGLYSPWNSPGQNTGVGSLSLLQRIFPIQGLNPGLPHCRQILYQPSHKGSPRILEWVAYPFSRGSSWPRKWTRVSCIAGRLFTNWATREALIKLRSKKKQKKKQKNKNKPWGLALSWMQSSSRTWMMVFFFLFLKFIYLYLFLWLCWVLVAACKIFSCGMWDPVPRPGTEPGPPALRLQSPSHWTTREVPGIFHI